MKRKPFSIVRLGEERNFSKKRNLFEFFKKLKNHQDKPHKKWLKRILWLFYTLLIGTFLFTLGYVLLAFNQAPDIDQVKNFTFAEGTTIYDRTGKHKLFIVHGDENRIVVSLSKISQNFINALIATEDDQFYSHEGLDYGGIFMAVCNTTSSKIGLGNLGGLCPQRGGSTITQQLIKNTILTPERTVKRKFQEWYLSMQIEQNLSKEEILELYANRVSFGRVSGIEMASRAFFNKHASELSIAEGAVLAGVIQRPSFFSPWGNHVFTNITISDEEIQKNGYKTWGDIYSLSGVTIIKGLRGQYITLADNEEVYFAGKSDEVLSRMKNLGFISETEYESAKKELSEIKFQPFREEIVAPHFIMYVREILEEEFGSDYLEQGGMKVITTLDVDMQSKAEEIVSDITENNLINYNAQNGALIALDNKTGQILTMVGSRDYWDTENDGNVNVLLSRRLPGSSFKPIVYATAFESAGLSPATVLFDTETDFGGDWKPKNYDGNFSGPVSIRKSLGHSLNIPAIKTCIIANSHNVVDLSNRMGISLLRDADFYGNAIALGAGEVRPLDMAQGFSVLANGGKKRPIVAILRVENHEGDILMDNSQPAEPEEVLNEEVAYLITDILADPDARGEGWNSRLQLNGRKNATKTGTSNKRTKDITYPLDAWTVGYTPQITTVVWTGNNDGSVMNNYANGFDTAGKIWKQFMEEAHKDLEVEKFAMPKGIKIIPVSIFSGKLPLPDTDDKLIVKEKFSSLFLPKETDDSLKVVEVDSISGKLPTKWTPESAIEKRAILNFHAYYPNNKDWENSVLAWLDENGREFVSEFGVEKFMYSLPTEEDSIHNEYTYSQNPQIKIISPEKNGIISPPLVNIRVQISAPNRGVKEVKTYLDGNLQDSSKTYPYDTKIIISKSAKGSHTLRIEATDNLFYTSSKEITVEIGKDYQSPKVNILYPKGKVSISSALNIMAEAYDNESAIKRVDFYMDGNKFDSKNRSPFNLIYPDKLSEDKHVLKVIATDTAGNTGEDRVEFSLNKYLYNADKFSFISPKNNTNYANGEAVPVRIGISEEMADGFESMVIYAKEENGTQKKIASFNASAKGRVFDAVFIFSGRKSQVFANIKYAGKSFNSERIQIF